MTQRYAIADYIPLEAREYAAGHTYHVAFGYCPMGRVLETLGDVILAMIPQRSFRERPAPYEFVTAFRATSPEVCANALSRHAFDFIRGWDAGEITDLRAALGLEPAT